METNVARPFEKKTPQNADPAAKALLEQAQAKMGMVPNLYAYMANSSALLQAYTNSYDLFRRHSGFTPVEQEVVFLTISFVNGCEYCMAAHSFVADTHSKVPTAVTDAIRNDTPIPDARLRALSTFTRVMTEKRGRPEEADTQAFLHAGFTPVQVLQIILAIGVKVFSNYTNHTVHSPVDPAFAGRVWQPPAKTGCGCVKTCDESPAYK